MKPTWRIFEIGLFVALVSVIGRPATVNSQSKDIIEGAKKEGKVLLYTALTIHEIDEIAVPFVKKYPFLKVSPSEAMLYNFFRKSRWKHAPDGRRLTWLNSTGLKLGNYKSWACYRATDPRKRKTIPIVTRTRRATGQRSMLTIWCSASIQRSYLSPTYRKNGRTSFSLNRKATNVLSTGTMRFGTAGWRFIGERKKLISS